MKAKAGEYLVVEVKNKRALVHVTEVLSDQIKGWFEKDRHDAEKRQAAIINKGGEIKVIANLGKNPPDGNVYGCKVEIWRDSVETDLGLALMFRKTDDAQKELLKKAAKKAKKIMKEKGLGYATEYDIRVYAKKGKYDGMLKAVFAEDELDHLSLMPSEFNTDYLIDIMFHEFGHSLEEHHFTPKMKASWIKRYHKYVKTLATKEKEMEEVLAVLLEARSIKTAYAMLEENQVAILDACVAWIHSNHYIDARRVNILLETDDDLSEYWPTDVVHLPDIESPLGEYSTKNPSEFWCESLRLHLGGKKLPKNIQKLMDKTLSRLSKH